MEIRLTSQMKITAHVVSVILLLIISTLQPSTAHSANYAIACSDRENVSTCSLSGSGGLSENFANTLQDMLRIAANDSNQTAELCQQNSATNYTCNVGSVQLFCDINTQAETASCNLGQNTPLQDVLNIECGTNGGDGAACNVIATPANVRNALLNDAPDSTIGIESAFLAGCAAQTGNSAFQQACAPILAAVQSGDPAQIAAANATMLVIANLNAEEAIEQTHQTAQASISHVNRRLSALRSGQTDTSRVDATALQIFDGNKWVRVGEMLAENHSDTITDISPPGFSDTLENFGRVGFFVDGSIISAEHLNNEVEFGSDLATQLVTWGFDYSFNERVVGGLAFSAGNTNIDYKANRGDLSDLGFLMMAYTGTYFNNFYLDASLGLGGNDYSQTRQLVCSSSCVPALQNMNQRAISKYSGTQTTFNISGGYDWSHNALSITPFAQLLTVRVNIDSYRETMSDPNGIGAGFALEMAESSYDTATLSIGAKVRYVKSLPNGIIIPHGSLALYQIMDNEAALIEGSFVGNVSTLDTFETASKPVDDSYLIINFGGLFQMANGISVFGDTRIIAGNEDLNQFQITVGGRWEL